ncbi:hypothetical protein [Streptomyces decoyicus]
MASLTRSRSQPRDSARKSAVIGRLAWASALRTARASVSVPGAVVDLGGVRGEVAGVEAEATGEFEDDVQRLVGQVVQGDVVLVDAEEVRELPCGHARVVLAAAQFLAPATGL